MTKQEIFDMAVDGLHKQEWRQALNGKKCVYLAENGDKCAVGHCIPEGKYNPEWDLESAAGDRVLRSLFGPLGRKVEEFVMELQQAHDTAGDPMRTRLAAVGVSHGLTLPACLTSLVP